MGIDQDQTGNGVESDHVDGGHAGLGGVMRYGRCLRLPCGSRSGGGRREEWTGCSVPRSRTAPHRSHLRTRPDCHRRRIRAVDRRRGPKPPPRQPGIDRVHAVPPAHHASSRLYARRRWRTLWRRGAAFAFRTWRIRAWGGASDHDTHPTRPTMFLWATRIVPPTLGERKAR